MSPSSFLRLALTGLVVVLSSCAGYRVGAVKPAALQGINSIAVPNFKNETLEPRIDVLMTNSTIARFQEDGTFQVRSAGEADAVLEARITDLSRRQLRSARFNTLRSRELALVATIEYRLVDADSRLVLSQGTVRADTTIFTDANFQNAERQALPQVGERAAEALVSRLSEGW